MVFFPNRFSMKLSPFLSAVPLIAIPLGLSAILILPPSYTPPNALAKSFNVMEEPLIIISPVIPKSVSSVSLSSIFVPTLKPSFFAIPSFKLSTVKATSYSVDSSVTLLLASSKSNLIFPVPYSLFNLEFIALTTPSIPLYFSLPVFPSSFTVTSFPST